MTAEVPALAALAVFGFIVAFIALAAIMVLVHPIWCIVDCAVDNRRSGFGKAIWIIVLILLYGAANWVYGAFAAGGTWLRRLTRLAWVLAILLVVAFAALYFSNLDFKRGIELEWRQRRPMMVLAPAAGTELENCT